MNSTTVLNELEVITKRQGSNGNIDLAKLAAQRDVTLPVLVSLLTELEHRDEIIIQITTTDEGVICYSGTVRLMDTPPDEKHSTKL